MRALLLSTTIVAGLAALPSAGLAQSTPVPGADPASAASSEPAAADNDAPDIVVTGSLIARRDFRSSSPISTVDSAALAATGQPSLDRALGQLPQFSGAQGAAEVGDTQGTIGFSGGQSYSDLRGLGPNRSLVLLDGRRLMPSSPDGAIDLNTIPSSLIGSVEIITGGASATYGSDAVAGVVNFKLRTDLSGLELAAKKGITDRGDGPTTSLSAAFGSKFADDRGSFIFALEYADRGTVAGKDRPFFANIRQLARPPEGIIAAGNYGGGAPTVAAVNAVLAGYPGTTPISGSGLYNGAIGVNDDGTIFTDLAGSNCVQNYRGLTGRTLGLSISPNCRQVQVALGQYFAVLVPLKRYNAFTRVNYELSDDITAYAQFSYMSSKARSQTGPASSKPAIPLLVPQNSPFVTGNPALQQILSSIAPRPTGNIIVTKLLDTLGNRVEPFKYDVWQGLFGLRGEIPGTRLQWNAYGSYGKSRFVNDMFGEGSLTAINTVLNGTANYSGTAGSCKGFAWNPFGNNPLSPGCFEYVSRVNHNTNDQSQKIVEATLQGPLFALPGGDLSFALGADYRETRFDYRPDSVLSTNDSIAYGLITPASGKQTVREVFAELLVPILKDTRFFQELTADLGYRYSDYNLFGGQHTYKADLSWRPFDPVFFRGGYSVAIRAPSLGNLFGPTSVAQLPIGTGPNAGDPCAVGSIYRTGANAAKVQALCLAQGIPSAIFPTYTYGISTVPGQDGSNRNLTPEKAKTYSFGVVLSPKFNSSLFNRVNLSVDYYHIKIRNAIGSLLLSDILPRCFNSDGVSNPTYSLSNAYCDRITRDPLTGQISLGRQGLFNFATYTVAGVDTQFSWHFDLDAIGLPGDAGFLELNSTASYTQKYKVAGLLGSPTINYAGSAGFGGVGGGISHPKWKVNTGLTYGNADFKATLLWRYVDKMVHSDKLANPASTTAGVPAYSYFDASAEFEVNDRFTFGVGVTNLTDKTPPFISASPLTTDAANYDVIGRTFFASVKAKF
ncbi:TonB-dependent receptor [Sphingomonas sp. ID1715]|uniref:TonB-dependent receptor domain-containing protein n=1 Tax=Sphingomonas sp. ID1715 TaxID=1656898 RepID=UPI001488D04B|nr:TonB-dependent receptor [Sphingomonas sp. ID1715]NNM78542.1 TonB-dependent receptor [Sphingomonas sp. ID1715]